MHRDLKTGPTLILAPIRGITDVVYREAFARCFGGFDRAVAPYLQPRRGHALRPVELRQVDPELNRGMKTIPQLLTNDPQTLVDALFELSDAGHMEVNWNLGCPSPNVAGRGRGAGLLPHPQRIDEILTYVLAKTPVKLSVKIRLGYKEPDEHLAVIDVLNRHSLTEVTLHARTGEQMYGGVADVARAEEALACCRHPFVYNGDITDPHDFSELQQRLAGAAGWMIGRGALMSPFLPLILKEAGDVVEADAGWSALPVPAVRGPRLRQFHDLLFDGYGQWLSGPGHLLDRMAAQWSYLAHSFADPKQVATRLGRCRDVSTYRTAVDWAFDQML